MALKDTVRLVGGLMELAARTAPKGLGQDFIEAKVLSDEERVALGNDMIKIATEKNAPNWERDGRNILDSDAVVLIGLCAVPLSAEEEEQWKTCSTPKTQYILQFPSSLIHSTAPAATGCAYQTADGEFNVEAVVEGESSAEETIDQRMEKEMELLGHTVTYKKKGDTWFVLSGVTSDGTEYYRKLFTNGSQWVTLRITYPHVRNKKYDKWVTRMEKTFVPFEKPAATKDESVAPTASPKSRPEDDGD
jgi:hypothetical protein